MTYYSLEYYLDRMLQQKLDKLKYNNKFKGRQRRETLLYISSQRPSTYSSAFGTNIPKYGFVHNYNVLKEEN